MRMLWQLVRPIFERNFHRGRGGMLKRAVAVGFIARIASIAATLITTPLIIRYLHNEGYGLMVTISSAVAWLQLTNLGLGAGLQNAFTDARAKGDAALQRSLISTALGAVGVLALLLTAVALLAFPHINWLTVFPPTSGRFTDEIPATVLVVFVSFLITLGYSCVAGACAAREEIYLLHVQSLFASLATVAGILIAIRLDLGLLGVTGLTVGIPALAQTVASLWYLQTSPELRPHLQGITLNAWRRIYGSSAAFFLIQLCGVALFQTDALIIAHFVTVDAVTPYHVAHRVFTQLSLLMMIVVGPLWAAYGNARAVGDVAWIRRTHRKILTVVIVIYGLVLAILIPCGQFLLSLWVGQEAAPSSLLIAAVGAHFFLRQWTDIHAVLVNGLDLIKPQAFSAALHTVITLTVSFALVGRMGPIALALGGIVGNAAVSAWFLPLLARRGLASISRPC